MNWDELFSGKLQEYFDIATDKVVYFMPKVFLALLIFWIGFTVIKKLRGFVDKGLAKVGITTNLRPFMCSIIDVVLKIFLFMLVANIVGADLTGLIAILAATGFAIGMALQGSLGNFASGVLILSLKPYKVGDWVNIEDKFGKVEEIGIFNTVVITPGCKTLIVPNSKITDSVVTNFSNKGVVRLEAKISMSYEESYPKVEKIIKDTLLTLPILLQDPKPNIGIVNFDSHNIEIAVRPYVLPDDFWEATFITNAAIKKAFSKNNVKVAYAEGVEIGPIGD